MAPGRYAPALGGAHSARTLEFLTDCLNHFFQTLYSSTEAFLTIENKNWPNFIQNWPSYSNFRFASQFLKNLDNSFKHQ